MTIVNVVLEESRAMVAVDTSCAAEGRVLTANKLLTMPAARSIVAGRGSAAFLITLFAGCYVGGAEDFDSLVETVRSCRDVTAAPMSAYLQKELGAERAKELDKNELTVVGWSRSAGRIKGWNCSQMESGGPYLEREIVHKMVGPGDDRAWLQRLRVDDPVSMVEVAKLQMASMRSRGELGVGGELIIARIFRGSMDLRIAATL